MTDEYYCIGITCKHGLECEAHRRGIPTFGSILYQITSVSLFQTLGKRPQPRYLGKKVYDVVFLPLSHLGGVFKFSSLSKKKNEYKGKKNKRRHHHAVMAAW